MKNNNVYRECRGALFLAELEKATGYNCSLVNIYDEELLSLFGTDECLKKTNKSDYKINPLLGIDELGTDFMSDLVEKIKPNSFDDLIKVLGLAHSTYGWNENGEKLFDNGAPLNEIFANREDISEMLIKHYNLETETAIQIMQDVRKGKGLTKKQTEILVKKSVPQYIIDSLNKIKYLPSKSHSLIRTVFALCEAYYKIHYPLEFYSVYLSYRAKQFELKTMQNGIDCVLERIKEIKSKKDSGDCQITQKEQKLYNTLMVVAEMEQRGYKFLNIDLYKSDAELFIIDNDRKGLIPPFVAIDGLGTKYATLIAEEVKKLKK